ncbi:MAG TPA: Vms1/Ankzf1 family peptidyl-tRNA hydrolase [Dehalococcoidia bacterium]|nr:Vms1/Ankzf1 family peptidyl-tRNA hydrolase [Dehalococcoidia bacterium]
MAIERTHVTRRQLLARLPDGGAAGVTRYVMSGEMPELADLGLDAEDVDRLAEVAEASETGCVLFAREADVTLVVPPFPVEEAVTYSELWPAILVELLERRRTVAVCLLRKGGFSAGVFRGEALVDSKTAQRFVKNRHRKGGQSQRRFDRIREKQVHELFGIACSESREKLEPYEGEIQHVFFGGDRHTLQAFRKECSYFERFGARVMRRVLPVPGDPRRALLEAMPREVWASDAYRVART